MSVGPNDRRVAARLLRTLQRLRAQAASRRAASGSAPNRSGFTLVELMVVIVIIGLLATVVAINVLPSQDRAMVAKARADIAVLEQAIETYRLDNLTFPDDQQGLQALVAPPPGLNQPERYRQGGYVRRLPEDPWGNPYQYRRQSAHGGQFDVYSWGADGREGGEGDDADLGNWQG
jgi:general secretion pathway protein G